MNNTIMLMAKFIQKSSEDCCKVCTNNKACNAGFSRDNNFKPDFNNCYIYIAEYFQNEPDKK